jgi:hypothetical protein
VPVTALAWVRAIIVKVVTIYFVTLIVGVFTSIFALALPGLTPSWLDTHCLDVHLLTHSWSSILELANSFVSAQALRQRHLFHRHHARVAFEKNMLGVRCHLLSIAISWQCTSSFEKVERTHGFVSFWGLR